MFLHRIHAYLDISELVFAVRLPSLAYNRSSLSLSSCRRRRLHLRRPHASLVDRISRPQVQA